MLVVALPPGGVPFSVGFGHATPRSVRLTSAQGVFAALSEHGAVQTNPPSPRFPLGPGVTTLPLPGKRTPTLRRRRTRRFPATTWSRRLPPGRDAPSALRVSLRNPLSLPNFDTDSRPGSVSRRSLGHKLRREDHMLLRTRPSRTQKWVWPPSDAVKTAGRGNGWRR